MTLRYPWMLLLLLLVPALVYVRHYRIARRTTLRFSDGETLRRLPMSWAVIFQWIFPALFAAGLTCLVIAMARPQRGLDESVYRTEAVDIVLLIDVSTSMRAEDFSTNSKRMNRLDSAKEVIARFIESRESDRIGAVAFSALPYTASPLTLDHDWLQEQVDRLKTGMLEDGTAIGSALASAVNRLRDSEAKSKVVVLLTDGENNAGTLLPENAAQAAAALGIKVYTVGAGSDGLVRMPVVSPFGGTRYVQTRSHIDEATLQRIADITDAKYFRATDTKSLRDVYKQIDDLEKTEVEVEKFTRYEEEFAGFAMLAMILLGLEKLLSFTRLGRLT